MLWGRPVAQGCPKHSMLASVTSLGEKVGSSHAGEGTHASQRADKWGKVGTSRAALHASPQDTGLRSERLAAGRPGHLHLVTRGMYLRADRAQCLGFGDKLR